MKTFIVRSVKIFVQLLVETNFGSTLIRELDKTIVSIHFPEAFENTMNISRMLHYSWND